jgi:hypothetical protein
MIGFKLDQPNFVQLVQVLAGDADESTHKLVEREHSHNSHLAVFLRGLRELPVSCLALAVESAEKSKVSTDLAEQNEEESVVAEASIRDFLQNLVSAQLRSQPQGHEPSVRDIIDQAFRRFLPPSATRLERLQCLELAGRIFGATIVQLSRDRKDAAQSLKNPLTASDTAAAAAKTTIDLCRTHPDEILARHDRLARLEVHNQLLARVYILHAFAGRTHAEIADLLELDLSHVEDAEQVATVEVCLSEESV